jgi:hypothetical protein
MEVSTKSSGVVREQIIIDVGEGGVEIAGVQLRSRRARHRIPGETVEVGVVGLRGRIARRA